MLRLHCLSVRFDLRERRPVALLAACFHLIDASATGVPLRALFSCDIPVRCARLVPGGVRTEITHPRRSYSLLGRLPF
jgi:hypothetical protein